MCNTIPLFSNNYYMRIANLINRSTIDKKIYISDLKVVQHCVKTLYS